MATYNVEAWLRHQGKYYKKGDKIKTELLSEKQQAQLVGKGVISRDANYADLNVVIGEEKAVDDVPPSEDEPIEKTLDLNFSAEELKEGAKEQGLSFKGHISKSAVIQLIVEANKQGYFLDQLDEGVEEDENI